MTRQLDIFSQPVVIHSRENNSESEEHLRQNREHFSKQCEKVLGLLKSGHRLTVLDAITKHGIASLPRRLKDLRDSGVPVKSEWKHDGYGAKYKVYYLER